MDKENSTTTYFYSLQRIHDASVQEETKKKKWNVDLEPGF